MNDIDVNIEGFLLWCAGKIKFNNNIILHKQNPKSEDFWYVRAVASFSEKIEWTRAALTMMF